VHPWRVLHAAFGCADLLDAVTLQAEAGMRPEVLTLDGLADPDPQWASAAEPISHSLLSAWHDVRSWRDALIAAETARFELVHAHSFSAGMAAVRNCSVVVYEIAGFVEQLAISAAEHGEGERPGVWLSRSLRVAEQFVIARAGAIVVRSSDNVACTLERGAAADDVFLIPHSGLCAEEIARRYDEAYHHASARREKTLTNRIALSLAPLAV
jgi:hypothetical protein